MTWDIWIKSNDCFDLLLLCSKSMMHNHNWLLSEVMGTSNNRTHFIDQDETNDDNLGKKQLGDEFELVNDLWMYLQEGVNSVDLQDYINRGEILSFKNLLMNNFINHLRDLRRQSSKNTSDTYRSFWRNPRCHYYRNACDAFRDELKRNVLFQYGHSPLTKAFFAFSGTNLLRAPQDILSTFEYALWPYPQEYLAAEQIFKAVSILNTAKLFWDETLNPEHLGNFFLLPVWELTSYVFSHVKVDAEFVSPIVSGEDSDSNYPEYPDSGMLMDQFSSVIKQHLKLCSIRSAAKWGSEVRKAFLLKYYAGLKLRELKSEGIASPQHRVEQAVIAIRDAWTHCYEEREGDFTLDNEAEELFMFFCECLEAACNRLQTIEEMACGIAGSWHIEIREAYLSICYKGITIEELEEKGMASPEHRLYQAVNQIRNTWTLWFGECTDAAMEKPENEAFFEFFCNSLAEICK